MRRAYSGSAVLLVLVMTTFLSPFVFSWWRCASYLYDVVVTREHYHQKVACTEVLLDLAVKYACKHFDRVLVEKSRVLQKRVATQLRDFMRILSANQTLLSSLQPTVVIKPYVFEPSKLNTDKVTKHEKGVYIEVSLFNGDVMKCCLCCVVRRYPKVTDKEKNEKKYVYVRDCFTLRPFI
jgi:hypothetical protein